MSLEIKKGRIKDYRLYRLSGIIDTQACFSLKDVLYETVQEGEHHICFDLSEISQIDSSGFRFMENVQKNLTKSNHDLVTFGANDELRSQIKEHDFKTPITNYPDLYTFEEIITKDIEETRKKFFKLTMGDSPIRNLALVCPLCETDDIIGFLCDENQHDFHWEESEITPQWRFKKDQENAIDFELYEVSVCHNCLFASSRLEHFTVTLPEGKILSILTQEEKDLLLKKSSSRNNLLNQHQKNNSRSFFSMPRENIAGFLSWQLYDRTIRDQAKDRAATDTVEVAKANILSAKFAATEEERNKALTTAQVWLADTLNNPDGHTTRDLVMANVYLISVSLALHNTKEAKRTYEAFMKRFERDEYFKFWTERARQLFQN